MPRTHTHNEERGLKRVSIGFDHVPTPPAARGRKLEVESMVKGTGVGGTLAVSINVTVLSP